MNLDVFKNKLIEQTANRFSWREEEADENQISISTDIKIKACDDEVKMRVECDEEGVLLVTYIFDAINLNTDTLKLVNYFNENVCFLKASILKTRRANYLKIEVGNPKCLSVENAVEQVLSSLEQLNSSSVLSYLKPLTIITEA
jgi:hypothetical protein